MPAPTPNPLKTRSDLQSAFAALEAPLLSLWKPDSTAPDVGLYRARYGLAVTKLEVTARYLWGLVPFTAGGGISRGWTHVLDAIVHGTDPQHPDYWGPVGDTDQRSVEMAAIGLALRLVPQQIWSPLSNEQKDRFATWLLDMLPKALVGSNWQFFRLMLTLGLRRIGRAPANVDEVEQKAIAEIDRLYLDHGWYTDGGPDQRDYYIPWAFHFYSLLNSYLAAEGPVLKRLEEWKARARTFTDHFIYWFSADGAALPFGRSLTYRFAQAAFWGGCGIASLPGLSAGEQKGFMLRNLRWWWKQPFLTADGVVSLGYSYPNTINLEPYNAGGSPYWALKAFAPLMLPETHPFWAEPEKNLPPHAARSVQVEPRMVIDRDVDSGHVIAHAAGQWHTWPLRHRDAKYAKFAYSTYFGPTMGPNHEWLDGVGLDNTISVVASEKIPDDGAIWQNHGLSIDHVIEESHLRSDWNSIPWLQVRSWIIPVGAWQVRVHRVTTDRVIQFAEGGFVAEDPDELSRSDQAVCLKDARGGVVGLINVAGDRRASVNGVEPNSSLYHSCVRGGMLVGRMDVGTHWVCASILGAAPGSKATWENPPKVDLVAEQGITVTLDDSRTFVDLRS